MKPEDLIELIMKSSRIEEVLDVSILKEEMAIILKRIHPDVCNLSLAGDATSKLLLMKEEYEHGRPMTDESGTYKFNGYFAEYGGDPWLLDKSFDCYNRLMSYRDDAAKNFKKYMPESMVNGTSGFSTKFRERCVSLEGLTLPQVHVNWIVSRMLEFVAWLDMHDQVHCGINPGSIFICPESHGVQFASFYMMAKKGDIIKNVSAKYRHWYPPQLFKDKKALPYIDLELIMKTGIYLLGDKSGSGIKLRRDHNVNQDMLTFMMKQHTDSYDTWKEYRSLLEKNFKKEFHVLNL